MLRDEQRVGDVLQECEARFPSLSMYERHEDVYHVDNESSRGHHNEQYPCHNHWPARPGAVAPPPAAQIITAYDKETREYSYRDVHVRN